MTLQEEGYAAPAGYTSMDFEHSLHRNRRIPMMKDINTIDRVLAVKAHPDDADVRCGGTIARFAAEGKEVAYVIATSGNRGGDGSRSETELAAQREEEQR